MTEPLKGLRVFVVEDEGLVAMLIETYLEDLGCEVVGHAARLDEAMAKARTLALDAAVLDVNLAGRLSYPVAELLLARDVRVVFATGYGSTGLPNEWRCIPILAKPFKPEQLADALRAVLPLPSHGS